MKKREERKRERSDEGIEAQYQPVVKGLDRPAAGGRDWELLIEGE